MSAAARGEYGCHQEETCTLSPCLQLHRQDVPRLQTRWSQEGILLLQEIHQGEEAKSEEQTQNDKQRRLYCNRRRAAQSDLVKGPGQWRRNSNAPRHWSRRHPAERQRLDQGQSSEVAATARQLKSADNKEIRVTGYFEYNFDTGGHKGRRNCHVADTQSLLGLDWIAENQPLF
ncbi:unnamed protein product [Toxocara canis]|uniref:Uncharacterized protein n=1 Tax=Toxocara canis TaxID=6265 RepID=A0A183USF6_TOXCA|nr:unnamed protein product [Toxocara canis]